MVVMDVASCLCRVIYYALAKEPWLSFHFPSVNKQYGHVRFIKKSLILSLGLY